MTRLNHSSDPNKNAVAGPDMFRRDKILVGDRRQVAALQAMNPGRDVLAFDDLRPTETAGGRYWLVVSLAGPPHWMAAADLHHAGQLHRWGAAAIYWLFVPELPADPALWPGCGLGPDDWADLLSRAPAIDPQDFENPNLEPTADGPAAGRPFFFDWRDFTVDHYLAEADEPDEAILADSLFRGDTGLIVAPGGTGKGFGAAQLGACLAAGQSFFDIWDTPKPFRVMYVSAEESQKTVRRRTRGAIGRLGLKPDEARAAAGRFVGLSIRGLGSPCLARSNPGGPLERTEALADLDRRAAEFQPDIIFLDHFAKFMPCNEIDNAALTAACGFLEELAVARHCAVVVLHHASKSGPVYVRKADDLFRSLDPSAIRGGSSLAANVRWALLMAPLTAEFAAKTLGPAAGAHPAGTFVAARVGKKNEGRGEKVFYLRHDSEGFFERVDSGQPDNSPEADARRLAAEVARRELDLSARPLTEAGGVRENFGWGANRAQRAVEAAVQLGLIEVDKRIGVRGKVLRPGRKYI